MKCSFSCLFAFFVAIERACHFCGVQFAESSSASQRGIQIQDQTGHHAPCRVIREIESLIALVFALALGGPWMVNSWLFFSRRLIEEIPALIG